MPKKLYTLDSDRNQILEVTWKGNFRNMEFKTNNKPIGKIEDKTALNKGITYEIDYDKFLTVKLVKEMYMFTELELLLNGQPVEGSMTHPLKKLTDVFWLIVFIGLINLILGLSGIITGAPFFDKLGVGYWNIIFAGIFILLGLMVKEKKSMIALIVIITLMFLDILSIFAYKMENSELVNPTGSIMVKIFLIIFLARGIKAIKGYRKMEAEKRALQKAREEKKKQTPISEQITENHDKFIPKDHSGYMPGNEG